MREKQAGEFMQFYGCYGRRNICNKLFQIKIKIQKQQQAKNNLIVRKGKCKKTYYIYPNDTNDTKIV
jgi:hypothetical protein